MEEKKEEKKIRLKKDGTRDMRYSVPGEPNWRDRHKEKQRQREHQRAKKFITIRVTPNERQMISQAAKRRGITLSAYLIYLARVDVGREREEADKQNEE